MALDTATLDTDAHEKLVAWRGLEARRAPLSSCNAARRAWIFAQAAALAANEANRQAKLAEWKY